MGNEMGNRNINGLQSSEQDGAVEATDELLKVSVAANDIDSIKDSEKQGSEGIGMNGSSETPDQLNDVDIVKDETNDLEDVSEKHDTESSGVDDMISMNDYSQGDLKAFEKYEDEEIVTNEISKASIEADEVEDPKVVNDHHEDSLQALEQHYDTKDSNESNCVADLKSMEDYSQEQDEAEEIDASVPLKAFIVADEAEDQELVNDHPEDNIHVTDEHDAVEALIVSSNENIFTVTEKHGGVEALIMQTNENSPEIANQATISFQYLDSDEMKEDFVFDESLAKNEDLIQKQTSEAKEEEETTISMLDTTPKTDETKHVDVLAQNENEPGNNVFSKSPEEVIREKMINKDMPRSDANEISLEDSLVERTSTDETSGPEFSIPNTESVFYEEVALLQSSEPINSSYLDAIDSEMRRLITEDDLKAANESVGTEPSEQKVRNSLCHNVNTKDASEELDIDGVLSIKAEAIGHSEEVKENANVGGLEELMFEQIDAKREDEAPTLVSKECMKEMVEMEADASVPELLVSDEKEISEGKNNGFYNTKDSFTESKVSDVDTVITESERKTQDSDKIEATAIEIGEKQNRESDDRAKEERNAPVASLDQQKLHKMDTELLANNEELVIETSPSTWHLINIGDSKTKHAAVTDLSGKPTEVSIDDCVDITGKPAQVSVDDFIDLIVSVCNEPQNKDEESLLVGNTCQNALENKLEAEVFVVDYSEQNPSGDREKTIKCDVFDVEKPASESKIQRVMSNKTSVSSHEESDKRPLLYKEKPRESLDIPMMESSVPGKTKAPLVSLLKGEAHVVDPSKKEEPLVERKTDEKVSKTPAKKPMKQKSRSLLGSCMCCTAAVIN